MHILFFTDHFWPEPSAPAAHVFERARLWVRKGHAVTVITNVPNYPEGRAYEGYRNRLRTVEDLEGIRVVRVMTFMAPNVGVFRRGLDYASYMITSFLLAFLERRPDVVLSTSPHLLAGLGGAAHAHLRRIPHVIEIRDLWPASILATTSLKRGMIYRFLEKIELWLYRTSSRVLTLTRAFANDIARRGVPSEKIDVVVNGANLELFSPRQPDPELVEKYGLSDRFVIGYLGTIGLAHGLENMLDVAERLKDRPISFLLVGAGAARESLKDQAHVRGLSNVIFVPRQLKEEMPRFWSLCEVGLVHLKDDPVFETVIPSKIFESMAMGLPILYVGPEGEGSRIVRDTESGIVVPPEDPAAFADAVRRLSQEDDLRARLAERSLHSAKRFSRVRQADATLEVLRRAMSG